jgi:hypothetical protein
MRTPVILDQEPTLMSCNFNSTNYIWSTLCSNKVTFCSAVG